jgi:hypothetical protein
MMEIRQQQQPAKPRRDQYMSQSKKDEGVWRRGGEGGFVTFDVTSMQSATNHIMSIMLLLL